MRITTGLFKGRQLQSPPTYETRPTRDRIKGSLFNILEHGFHIDFTSQRVLDLYAGSGSLGFEALSRGATYCLFIDHNIDARAALRANIEMTATQRQTKIMRRDILDLGQCTPQKPFNLCFIDPPYKQDLVATSLLKLHQGQWLQNQAILIIEMSIDDALTPEKPYTILQTRHYGVTQLLFIRYDG